MKVTEQIYQVSGAAYGTNSNTFLLCTEKGWVLVDAGFSEIQLEVMAKNMKSLGIKPDAVREVLLTHAHFDHAGNARYFQKHGAKIKIGRRDKEAVEQGGPSVLETLFQKRFSPCEKVWGLKDEESLDYGDITVRVIETPGHTPGSVAYLAETPKTRVLFTGDLFVIPGVSPQEEVQVELGWNGDPFYDWEANQKTFERLREMEVDVIAPGHGTVYYGNSREIFEKLYRCSREA